MVLCFDLLSGLLVIGKEEPTLRNSLLSAALENEEREKEKKREREDEESWGKGGLSYMDF